MPPRNSFLQDRHATHHRGIFYDERFTRYFQRLLPPLRSAIPVVNHPRTNLQQMSNCLAMDNLMAQACNVIFRNIIGHCDDFGLYKERSVIQKNILRAE